MCLCLNFPCTCDNGGIYGTGKSYSPLFGNPAQAPNAGIGAYLHAGIAQQNAHAGLSALNKAAINQTILQQLAAQQSLAQIPIAPPPRPLERAETRFGEIIGWRIWKIKDGFLGSYSASYTWVPGMPAEGIPGDHDSGGIWAFKGPARALHKLPELPDGAMGSVELYGDIVEHADGYRAQYAMVRSIDQVRIIRGDTKWWKLGGEKKEILRALREAYGVEA